MEIFLYVLGGYLILGVLAHFFGKNSRPGFDHRDLRDPEGTSTGFNRRT